MINFVFSLVIMTLSSAPTSTDCTLENFVGTWKGKVEFQGDELAQGPYEFYIGEDGKSLHLKDETGAIYELKVDACNAVNEVEEEGMKMKTTYTYEEGSLKIHSTTSFPDAEGKMISMEMKGSMSKI